MCCMLGYPLPTMSLQDRIVTSLLAVGSTACRKGTAIQPIFSIGVKRKGKIIFFFNGARGFK